MLERKVAALKLNENENLEEESEMSHIHSHPSVTRVVTCRLRKLFLKKEKEKTTYPVDYPAM